MVNQSIFKSYDIRGIYPSEINEESAFIIGKAIAFKTKAEKIVIGRDGRLSSDSLFKALSEGILSSGADVIDIGQVPTECLYYAVGKLGGAGVMITASHNPKEYNGFKVIGKDLSVINGFSLKEAVLNEKFEDSSKKGNIEKKEGIVSDYVDYIFNTISTEKIKDLKIVIDCGNGMFSKIIPILKNKLSIEIIEINSEIDGSFPARGANPQADGTEKIIAEAIKENKADAGFMFDGDADRIFLVTEKGERIFPDISLIAIAKYFLDKNPGEAIAYNVMCSNAVPEFISKWGGKPIRTKVGFVYVQKGMVENNGIMGGEFSGHYCFRDCNNLDSGLIALLAVLNVFKKPVSEFISQFMAYKKESIKLPIKDGGKIIEAIKEKYLQGKQDELDGITVQFENWWLNARPSNTEPMMWLTIEADNEEIFEEKKQELLGLITPFSV